MFILLEQFVVVTSLLAFMYAGTTTQLETENWKKRMTALSPVWSVRTITNTDMKRAQAAELIQVSFLSWVEARHDITNVGSTGNASKHSV